MRANVSDRIVSVFSYVTLTILAMLCLYPVVLAFSVSISDDLLVAKYGYLLIPKKLSLDAYKAVFNGDWILQSYFVTITVVVVGTLLSIIVSSMLAYAISVKTLKYRNTIALFCFITMIFNVGLVPWYIVTYKILQPR